MQMRVLIWVVFKRRFFMFQEGASSRRHCPFRIPCPR